MDIANHSIMHRTAPTTSNISLKMPVIFQLSPGLEWIEPLMYLDKAQYFFYENGSKWKKKDRHIF